MKLIQDTGRVFPYRVVNDENMIVGFGKTPAEAWQNTAEELYNKLDRVFEVLKDLMQTEIE